MKKIIKSIFTIIIILTLINITISAYTDGSETEQIIAVVIKTKNHIVFSAQDGTIWKLKYNKKWQVGDIVILTIKTKGTTITTDDTIIRISKCGHLNKEGVIIWLS